MTRRLKPLAIAAGLALAVCAVQPAQAGFRHAGGAAQRESTQLQNGLAQLNLTNAQHTQVAQILASAHTGARANTAGRHARHGKSGLVSQVMAVLTPDQQSKLKQLLQANHPQRAAPR